MGWLRLGLRIRIFFGFGVLVALLLYITAYGGFGLERVGDQITRMKTMAVDAERAQDIGYALEIMRRGLTTYRIDADEASLKEVTQAVDRSRQLVGQAEQAATTEEQKTLLGTVAARLQALSDKQARFSRLLRAGLEERKTLTAAGNTLLVLAANLVDAASAGASPAEQAAASAVRTALVSAEASSLRFLASSDLDPVLVDGFHKDVAFAADALTALAAVVSPPVKSRIAPMQDSLKAFAASFDRTSGALIEGVALFDKQIRPDISDLQTLLARTRDDVAANLAQTSVDANRVATGTLQRQVGLSVTAAVIGLVLAGLLAQAIIRPVRGMTRTMTALAAGHTETQVPAQDNTDEFGALARAVEVLRQKLIGQASLAVDRDLAHLAQERRRGAIDRHTQDFGASVTGVMQTFMAAADAMREAAARVAEGAREMRANSASSMDGAVDSERDLSAVSFAAEEMAVSINEINQQLSHVTLAVRIAVERSAATDAKVAELSVAADRIGDVVQLISDIADQTNLLALNATIEAARAGDAGKGFAVVAGEVKALATQTAQATDDISDQIVSMRATTDDAVSAVREVGLSIAQVEAVATAIVSAVEQQSVATHEITNRVQAVSAKTAAAANAMRALESVAENADVNCQFTLDRAEEVSQTAATLRDEVTDFLSAMSRGSESDKRLYERVPGHGARATLSFAGGAAVEVKIKDISRGGMAVAHPTTDELGTDVEVGLPGDVQIKARIARRVADGIGLAFRQDPASLALIDRAMQTIGASVDQAAA